MPYSSDFTAQGGLPPYTWFVVNNINELPPGLTLASSYPDTDNVLTETPTQAGTFSFLMQVQDSWDNTVTAALVARDPAAHVFLDDPDGVARLLGALLGRGAREQAAALADRLPGSACLGCFLEQQGRQDRFRFGREADGSPTGPWGWDDLE